MGARIEKGPRAQTERAATRSSKPAGLRKRKRLPRTDGTARATLEASEFLRGDMSDRGRTSLRDFEMIPGRYPDAVSFPQVLEEIGHTDEGQHAIHEMLDNLEAKSGIQVPTNIREGVTTNPGLMTMAFEVTPSQISSGIKALNKSYQEGAIRQVTAPTLFVPQNFDLSELQSLVLPRPEAKLKPRAPGIFSGDLPSDVPDENVKFNRVVAEVFDRLAKNAGVETGEKFTVRYGGQAFDSLPKLIDALKTDGYSIDVRFKSRVANFSNLKKQVPGSNPPQYLDVPVPLMVKTGIYDAQKNQAIVPAVHSEMVVSLRSGPATRGPKIDADVKFYQGVGGTGFFPCHLWRDPTWCGQLTTGELSGDRAIDAVKLAGCYTDLIHATSKQMNLYADGYGVTGVCNDSVAIVEQAVMGTATQYPLLMKQGILLPAISQRLSDSDPTDDGQYAALRTAIDQLSSDVSIGPSSRTRALASIPWPAGREPFASTESARRVLTAAGGA